MWSYITIYHMAQIYYEESTAGQLSAPQEVKIGRNPLRNQRSDGRSTTPKHPGCRIKNQWLKNNTHTTYDNKSDLLHINRPPQIWKGVSATLQSGKYTLSYPRGLNVETRESTTQSNSHTFSPHQKRRQFKCKIKIFSSHQSTFIYLLL